MNQEKQPTNATFLRRRVLAAGAIALTLVGGFELGSKINSAFDDLKTEKQFSQPDLADHLGAKVNQHDVLVHVIGADERTPIDAANKIGAANTILVANEIAGQVGGADSMNIGERVVIPLDQLEK